MASRYFVSELITTNCVTLDGAEAHHLLHVMRAKAGDRVTLFDGSGCEFSAEIDKLSRAAIELSVLAREEISRELAVDVTLAVALPKGDRQKWLIEKAVELGVKTIVPLQTERSVAQPTGKALQRLERSVIEASKQCERNQLMTVDQPVRLADYLQEAATCARVFAHPSGTSFKKLVDDWHTPTSVQICVGPEGGFSDDEVELAAANDWNVVSLGQRILRIETAALSLVSIVSHQCSSEAK